MRRYIPFAIVLTACTSSPLMTVDDFSKIETGTPIAAVEKKYGPPLKICSGEENKQIYEYVERITMGTQYVEMRRYYFVVKDGKIVNKYVKYNNAPGYEDIYTDDPFPEQTQ